MTKKKSEKLEPMEEVKRLLILALVHSGVQAKDIADVLGVDKSAISRIVPSRQVKKK